VQHGGLPAVQDFEKYADVNGFEDRLDEHSFVLTDVLPGTYFVAVYNNDAYFKVALRHGLNMENAMDASLIAAC
jgi:hypothetical protein